MLARLGQRIAAFFRASAPDPFVIAVLLTALTFGLVIALTDSSPGQIVASWSAESGMWAFLRFAMQMCLILVTGHALAASPPVAALLRKLASTPKTASHAVALVAFVAAGLGVLNWGLGLIGGALLARRVGEACEEKGVRVHYPLLVAAGYVGLLVWHGGFSGTAPLKVTTASQLHDVLGDLATQIKPMSIMDTLLSPLNVFVTGGLLTLAPLVLSLMHPKESGKTGEIETIRRFVTVGDGATPNLTRTDGDASRDAVSAGKSRFVALLEDTPIVNVLLALLIGAWAIPYYFPRHGASGVLRLTPDTVNLTMLMLGLLLHGTPMRYVRAVEDAARGCAGIILQFPLYAGIMGMMHDSGLTEQFSRAIANIGGSTGLPLFTFASAGAINLFIPSGGGQWGVQGPVAMQAALDAGVAPAKMVMAIAYGDELTNMLQPFWALPLLAVTGVKARDIVGYTAVLMLVAGAWMALCLLAL